MNFISCGCGIVLDLDQFSLEYMTIYNLDGSRNENVYWNDNKDVYVAVIDCPVCKSKIETEYIVRKDLAFFEGGLK